MLIEFINAKNDYLIQEKESEDIKHILNSITRVGTKMKFVLNKDETFSGSVKEIVYEYNFEESNDEDVLKIFLVEDLKESVYDENSQLVWS